MNQLAAPDLPGLRDTQDITVIRDGDGAVMYSYSPVRIREHTVDQLNTEMALHCLDCAAHKIRWSDIELWLNIRRNPLYTHRLPK